MKEEEEKERERKKDFRGQSLKHPDSITVQMGFRAKASTAPQCGRRAARHPLVPPQQRRNPAFCKIPLVAGDVLSSHASSRTRGKSFL